MPKYQGADNYNYNDGGNEVLSNIIGYDYTSLYPSIMIGYNISVDKFIKGSVERVDDLYNDPDVIELQVSDVSYDIRYTYFYRSPGIVTTFQQQLLKDKSEYKKLSNRSLSNYHDDPINNYNDGIMARVYENKRKNVKVMLNGQYGMSGM